MNEPIPNNPFGEIAQLATTVHEVYVSYVEAGFTEQQALYLVACHVTGGPKEPRA